VQHGYADLHCYCHGSAPLVSKGHRQNLSKLSMARKKRS
jgi:hypothetical protein